MHAGGAGPVAVCLANLWRRLTSSTACNAFRIWWWWCNKISISVPLLDCPLFEDEKTCVLRIRTIKRTISSVAPFTTKLSQDFLIFRIPCCGRDNRRKTDPLYHSYFCPFICPSVIVWNYELFQNYKTNRLHIKRKTNTVIILFLFRRLTRVKCKSPGGGATKLN